MSVSGTLTKESPDTAAGNVINDVSLLHISGNFVGSISLEVAPAGTSDFVIQVSYTDPVAVPINTPDTSVDYKITSQLTSGSANVYLGQ